ncbi:MAG: SpoIIE family protein phosphatase [Bacteroidia bacterium]|nr:SpoIIE family protein phosphatase [Bacteroidia bacterium]MDW8134046.1 SpoIIE family protein phosphatase [Bacteroidia bacterium]
MQRLFFLLEQYLPYIWLLAMGAMLSEIPQGFSPHHLIRELEIKRGEVEALQEVVRLLAPKIRDTALLVSVASILRSRFGVQRMAYIHTFTPDHAPRLSYFHNFPSISQEALREAITYTVTSVPHPDSFLEHMGVEIVMPLGRFIGPTSRVRIVEPRAWWLLGQFATTEEEKANDLLYLEIIGILITVYLENTFFQEQQRQAEILRLQQQAYEQEIALASRIQRRILSTANPAVHPRLDIATFHSPHQGIGGDLFDFIRLDEKRVLFYIGDVSGKGISAALVMSNLQGHIQSLAELNIPLPVLLEQLHRRLLQLYGDDDTGFVTLFLGLLELQESGAILHYFNAAHPPPLLIRKGSVHALPANLTMLGISIPGQPPLSSLTPTRLVLYPNDLFLAYTDGLIEQTNPAGQNLGIEYLMNSLASSPPPDAATLIAQVRQILDNFKENVPLEDDTSLVACHLL